jgi:flagellar biosynthesis protein
LWKEDLMNQNIKMHQNNINKIESCDPDEHFKSKTAVALSYDPEEEAPKVIAAGKGYLAEKIIEKAKEADIPLHTDAGLAATLSKLEIGEMIPAELYEVVSEILVFVDKMDRIKGKIIKHEQ